MSNKKSILNPNKLTSAEVNFLHAQPSNLLKDTEDSTIKLEYKSIMVSIPKGFLIELNNFLKANPTEGSRSSFITRIVADYLKKNTNQN